jgi:hypothetical protein
MTGRVKSVTVTFEGDVSSHEAAGIVSAIQGTAPKGILGPDGKPATILPDLPDEKIYEGVIRGDDLVYLRALQGVLQERPTCISSWERKFVETLIAYRDGPHHLKRFTWKQRRVARQILKRVFNG